jgi:hypothetical protein
MRMTRARVAVALAAALVVAGLAGGCGTDRPGAAAPAQSSAGDASADPFAGLDAVLDGVQQELDSAVSGG